MTEPDPTGPPSTEAPGRAVTGQFVVDPVRPAGRRRPSAWPVAGALAVVAVVVLTAWGVAGSPAPTAAPANVVPAVTAPTAPAMEIVDVATSNAALDELARLGGWGGCPVWRAFDVASTVAPRTVEAAISASGSDRGFLDVADAAGVVRRVWVGGDVRDAARAFGGTFLVREADADWTVIPVDGSEVAVRLKPTARRDGGEFWQVSGRAAPAPYCVGRGTTVAGPVRVIDGATDARVALFTAAGWAACRTWQRAASQNLPASDAIERAAAAALVLPDTQGWIDLPAATVGGDRPVRAWLGADEREVARAHGSSLMVTGAGDPGEAWLRVSLDDTPAAIELLRVHTSGGWTAWIPTPNAGGPTRTELQAGCATSAP